MSSIFTIVYQILLWISSKTGFSYNEINIIVYYLLLPFFFLYLLDKIWSKNYLKIGFACIVLVSLIFIPDFESFSNHLFSKSVDFLKWFEIIGWNYVEASVIICVGIPFIILLVLLYLIKTTNQIEKQTL